MIEQLIERALSDAPNLIFAALTLYWMSKRLDRSIDLSENLIERCFEQQEAKRDRDAAAAP